MSELYGLTVIFLIFILMPVAIILSVAYAIRCIKYKHEHEWEKVIDTCDSVFRDKVVVYRCKSCGKKKRYKV